MATNHTPNRTSLETLFARANEALDEATGGVVPPFQPATTFARRSDYSLVSNRHLYARDDNDVVRLAEETLTIAENGEAGLLFPSGMAAIAAVMRTIPNGGRLIMQSQIYWGTMKWVREFCARREIELVEVAAHQPAELVQTTETVRPDIVFVETPSNPWLRTVDLRAASQTCKAVGARLVVDSTAATPVLSQPLGFGADIVMHSATKAVNGHSDVVAGFLCTGDASSDFWTAIRTDRHDAGAILGSFEAWLLLRGMRTLPLRVERMSANAAAIAEFLTSHNNVLEVLYPGLSTHLGHELAQVQMSGGFGSLLSFRVKGSGKEALNVCGRLNLFHRATSLGGVESLVEHRHTIEGDVTGVPDDLIRVSVGIEHVDELIADLDQALSGAIR
ncbi:MAG: PLP-dependent transferase [Pseudomonadota bacterium]